MSILLDIREEGPESFADHGAIPISFTATSRVILGDGEVDETDLSETAIEPRYKDYDENPENRPTTLAVRFDVSNWILIAAYSDGKRIGGAIVARDCPGYDLLEGGKDLAHIVDIRVHPAYRGLGAGRAIVARCMRWAAVHGCSEMRVETQDINVAACRFYAANGFKLLSFEEGAYRPDLDEARLIWAMPI